MMKPFGWNHQHQRHQIRQGGERTKGPEAELQSEELVTGENFPFGFPAAEMLLGTLRTHRPVHEAGHLRMPYVSGPLN